MTGEELEISYQPYHQTRYMLGFNYVADNTPAQVTSITLNLPLHKAGMLAGDIITSVDGKEVASGRGAGGIF